MELKAGNPATSLNAPAIADSLFVTGKSPWKNFEEI